MPGVAGIEESYPHSGVRSLEPLPQDGVRQPLSAQEQSRLVGVARIVDEEIEAWITYSPLFNLVEGLQKLAEARLVKPGDLVEMARLAKGVGDTLAVAFGESKCWLALRLFRGCHDGNPRCHQEDQG
jgi:hypothetical protein